MPIKYALFENDATSDPDDYRAVVQITGSVDLDQIATELATNSTFSKAEVIGLLESLTTLAGQKVANGQRVNIGGLVSLWPTIKGVFNSAADEFSSTRHRIRTSAKSGSRISDYVSANATVEKDIAIPPSPVLIQFRDIGSGTSNDQLTPGNIGELTGSRLKYKAAQADEGVFFIPVGGGNETKVQTVQKNLPAQLVFLVPTTLAAGDYNLEVRSRLAGSSQLRTGQLDTDLTVA